MLTPKPRPIPFILPRPIPEPKRLPARKAVTIVAGFHFADGVLICADTEITENFAKYQGSKIRGYDIGPSSPGDKVVFAITGSVPHAERAIQLCGNALSEKALRTPNEMTNDGIQNCIEQELSQFYQQRIFTHPLYGQGRQDEPGFDLLIGIWSHVTGRTSLFATREDVVTLVRTFECLGIGSYFARYVSQSLFRYHLSLSEVVLLATHILQQTKNNVPNCGKRSEFMVLKSGEMSANSAMEISLGEQYSDSYVRLMSSLLFDLANTDKDFEEIMATFRALALGLRKSHATQRAGYDALVAALSERQAEFAKAAKRYHRRDPAEVASEISEPTSRKPKQRSKSRHSRQGPS
jgi:20S proteasome alpha/beta subunit